MRRKRTVKRADGEWFRIERKGHIIQCCDCGLVHLVRSRLRGKSIEIAATRLPRNTASARKARGVKVVKRTRRDASSH